MSCPTILATPTSPRSDLYTRVTKYILTDLECGVRTWTKPWSTAHAAGQVSRPQRATGEAYRGINILLLWSEAIARGFDASIWMTYRQAQALGGQVRKGEKGTTIVYANRTVRTETDETGADIERQIPFLKAYTVFNVDQVDGLPDRFQAPAQQQRDHQEKIAHAETYFSNLGGEVRHGGDMAFYAGRDDHVQLPQFAAFDDAESYYATLAHEFVHWTRHPSRLDRDFGQKRFGDDGYALEELVAELGAAFLCADLQLELTPRHDHSAYLGHWLRVLKAEPKLLFTAAAYAQRACDFLHGRQPSP